MKVVLLEPLGIPEEMLEVYAARLRASGHEFAAYGRDERVPVKIERARDADALIIANMPLEAEVIDACERLKFIDVAFTGVDHVALDAARRRGVKVSNAAGYSTKAVSELALCMMLSLLRNVPQVDGRCRDGLTKDGLVGGELCGKTVGVVGVGAIGGRVAELCHAFGCRVLGNKRNVRGDEPGFVEFVGLDELLRESDIVSLHCPLTDETRGLMNGERIGMMKRGALLINTSRGPVVESGALADALRSGRIGGAGIDVFEVEPPLPAGHPLLQTPNTIVTPHVAFASRESMERRAEIVFGNLAAWLSGGQKNVVL